MEKSVAFSSSLRWHRAIATGIAIVFVLIALWSAVINYYRSTGEDFLSFWAAGKLVLRGQGFLAYDIVAHGMVENMVVPIGGRMPFPYPPPFLAIVTPFALAPFGIAFPLWVSLTAVFFAVCVVRAAPLNFAFSSAAACIEFMIGQSGFLICGFFILGLTLISSAPLAAGAILGLLILKPQLALLLPVAMLAGREWRVIAGAILSAAAVLALGLLLFGAKSYEGFWNILPHYVALMKASRWPWNELASPFALARYVGVGSSAALWIHSAVALGAAIVTARAWWLKLDERIPILAAATMLVPPYIFTYDALLMAVPVGWLVRQRRPYMLAFVWFCCFVPVVTYFSPWVAPNLISIAAIASLCALHQRGLRRRHPDKSSPVAESGLCVI